MQQDIIKTHQLNFVSNALTPVQPAHRRLSVQAATLRIIVCLLPTTHAPAYLLATTTPSPQQSALPVLIRVLLVLQLAPAAFPVL